MTHERTLLGQLLNRNKIYYEIDITADDFSDERNRKCFKAMENLILQGYTADLPTVATEQTALTPSELSEIADVPSSANASYYAEQVREATRKKRIRSLAPIIVDKVDTVPSSEMIELISSEITDIQANRGDYRTEAIGDGLMDYVSFVEKRYNSGGDIPGVSTGFPQVDGLTLGLQQQQYWIIAGRPSDGKSAVAVQWVKNIGLSGVPVGLMSLETSRNSIINRMVADVSNVNSQRLMSGTLHKNEFAKMTDGVERLYNAPIYIYDKPNASIQDIQAEARRMVNEWGVKAIFLDYIQLVQAPGEKEYERVSNASMQLKSLWRNLNICGVVLAQIHRHDSKKPTKSNLKGSGQIEQDADTVMLLYHDYNGDEPTAYWIFDKNRDGPAGEEIEMYFDRDHVRFQPKKSF